MKKIFFLATLFCQVLFLNPLFSQTIESDFYRSFNVNLGYTNVNQWSINSVLKDQNILSASPHGFLIGVNSEIGKDRFFYMTELDFANFSQSEDNYKNTLSMFGIGVAGGYNWQVAPRSKFQFGAKITFDTKYLRLVDIHNMVPDMNNLAATSFKMISLFQNSLAVGPLIKYELKIGKQSYLSLGAHYAIPVVNSKWKNTYVEMWNSIKEKGNYLQVFVSYPIARL